MLLLKWLEPHSTITQTNSIKPTAIAASILFSSPKFFSVLPVSYHAAAGLPSRLNGNERHINNGGAGPACSAKRSLK